MDSRSEHPGLLSTLTTLGKSWLAQLNPMGRAVVTVSLEGTSLRITASSGRRILAWVNLLFNPQLVTEDLVNNPSELANVIRNALRRLGHRPSAVLAVYPGQRILSGTIPVPRAQDIAPAVVIPREARRLLGAVPEQNYIHWRRIARDRTTDQYYVLAIPRVRMDAFVNALAGAGLLPKVVELKAIALSRATGASEGIIVNLEQTYVTFITFSNYIPQTVNTVPLDEMTALDEQEVTERLLEELRRSLAYYQERTTNPRVLPLVLSGGHPILEGDALAQAIQRNLSITPIVPKLPFSYPTDFPVHAYLANLGTLLR